MNHDDDIKKYLRPWKAQLMLNRSDRIECRPKPGIVKYNRVCLTPLGQIYDDNLRGREGLVFEDTGFCSQISPASAKEYTYKKLIYGGYLRHKWGHFISESLARIWALNQPEIDEDSKILFFSDSTSLGMPGGNFRQVFELLGIADRIIIADKEILAEELTVPDLSYEHDVFYTKEQSHVYRKIISKALESQPSAEIKYAKKVFISRAGIPGAVKNAVNLMELEQYFKDNGFATISPEQISLIDLIHIMDSADTIASIGGTPAHNFVFVNRPDSKHLIIIERHPCVNDFQISLNKMTGCQTINVDAFYLPKAASSQDGIMLFAPTPQFCEFAANLNFIKEGHFVDDAKRQRRRELRKFLSRYRRYWCSGDALCPWEIYSGQAIAEAMVASRERYREWLQDSLPIMWYDYLTPRALLRMVISYLRKKL